MEIEIAIVKFFNRLGTGPVDRVTDALSRVKFMIVFWIVVVISFLFFDKQNGKFIFLVVMAAGTLHFLITEGLIKHLLTKIWGVRRRPYLCFPEIKSIGREFTDSSFPSSHMAATVSMLWVIVSFYQFFWPLAAILAVFMAYARMHQGMHYFSDILAGTVLGVFYGWAGIYIVNQIFLANNF